MLKFLFYFLWVAPPAVLAFVSVMMIRHGLKKQYPFFFSYVAFQVVGFVAQFSVYHLWPKQYYFEYWTGAILSIALSFAVIYELFTQVFEPFDGLRDLGGVLGRGGAGNCRRPDGVHHFGSGKHEYEVGDRAGL
jgi:hypothetical protein